MYLLSFLYYTFWGFFYNICCNKSSTPPPPTCSRSSLECLQMHRWEMMGPTWAYIPPPLNFYFPHAGGGWGWRVQQREGSKDTVVPFRNKCFTLRGKAYNLLTFCSNLSFICQDFSFLEKAILFQL
jgi:hypothetical protein